MKLMRLIVCVILQKSTKELHGLTISTISIKNLCSICFKANHTIVTCDYDTPSDDVEGGAVSFDLENPLPEWMTDWHVAMGDASALVSKRQLQIAQYDQVQNCSSHY